MEWNYHVQHINPPFKFVLQEGSEDSLHHNIEKSTDEGSTASVKSPMKGIYPRLRMKRGDATMNHGF